ncbi:MAG TPA: Fic family protein [Acidimicrobiales bacterium]|nr:Fic family protein [Acidimicrobiales bacterium]
MLFETPELDAQDQRALERIAALRQDLRWRVAEPRRWFGSLRRLSMARVIQGSNSIEGYNADLDDVVAEAEGEEVLDPRSETRLALRGYREAMTMVLQVAGDPHFEYNEMLLRSLQFMMTSYDLKKRPGQWRSGSIFVRNVETGDVVYEGPDVDLVPGLMAELVDWLRQGDERPALAHAAMAHLNLVMIHPFRDGNGRMARCLQSLVLAREGILAPPFASIEEYLGRNTQAYYDVLAEVGAGRWQPERDARPWVRFCLWAHYRQARTLLQRVKEAEQLWGLLEDLASECGLPERVVGGLYDAALGLRVRNATYRSSHEDLSENLASRDLRAMVDAGLLIPYGERRGRHYVGAPRVREVYASIRKQRSSMPEDDPFAP